MDYEDAYAVQVRRQRPARWWLEAMLADGPRWFTVPWIGAARFVLRADVGPLAHSPDHVYGWRVLVDEPRACVIALDAAIDMQIRLISTTGPTAVTVSTQLRIGSRRARTLWPLIEPAHRVAVPRLLTRAVRSAADGDGP